VSNAFWSFALPQGFERIFKQITHIGVSITLKLQDWVFTRMHCIITFHNVNKVYKTLVFYLLITFRFFFPDTLYTEFKSLNFLVSLHNNH